MAEFTALHRLKPIFMVDEMSQKFEPKDVMGLRSRKITRLSSYNCNKITRNTRVFASAFGRRSKSVNENETNAILDQEAIYDGLLGDPDYESHDLSCFRGLILDISYRPINVVCWKRAICLEFMEKADVLEYYDQTVNSPNGSFYIPAVLRVPHLLQVVKRRRTISTLSRKNILARDNFSCQ
ncbi:hypothetical protein Tco_0753107 [Tanacetum coccineum]